MVKNIIFDFDGTIANTLEEGFKIINNLSKKYRYKPLDINKIDKYRNQPFLKNIEETEYKRIFKLFIVKDFKNNFKKIVASCSPYPQIPTLLQDLKKFPDIKLGILSSNSEKNIIDFLKNNNLFQYFDFVKSESNIFGKDKAILKLINKYKLNLDECIYVGDESRDIESCKKINLRSIAVGWGYNDMKFLEKFNPTFKANTVLELKNILKANIDNSN